MTQYTAQDFASIPPSVLAELGITISSNDAGIGWIVFLSEWGPEKLLHSMPMDHAAAFIIGMVAERCGYFRCELWLGEWIVITELGFEGLMADDPPRGSTRLAAVCAAFAAAIAAKETP